MAVGVLECNFIVADLPQHATVLITGTSSYTEEDGRLVSPNAGWDSTVSKILTFSSSGIWARLLVGRAFFSSPAATFTGHKCLRGPKPLIPMTMCFLAHYVPSDWQGERINVLETIPRDGRRSGAVQCGTAERQSWNESDRAGSFCSVGAKRQSQIHPC